MKPFSPTSRRQRAALALVSGVLSVSLLASVLMLFSDDRVPAIRLEAAAAAASRIPSCTASSVTIERCIAPVAQANKATATAMGAAPQPPVVAMPVQVARE